MTHCRDFEDAGIMDQPRARSRRVGKLRPGRLASLAWHGLTGLSRWRDLLTLWSAPPGSTLSALVNARPEIWGMLHTPFLKADWQPKQRFGAIITHAEIADTLGRPFTVRPSQYAELLSLDEIAPGWRLTLDQPRWLLRDGLLALSLWHGEDRLFSIAFVLGRDQGRLTAYVGGVQGRRGSRFLELYKVFTKAAHGMRPRDFLIDSFRILMGTLGARQIFGIADARRYHRSPYFTSRRNFVDVVAMDYDAMWRERGGTMREEGWHMLSAAPRRRSHEEVPARKRALYRRRNALIESVAARLALALRFPDTIAIATHDTIYL